MRKLLIATAMVIFSTTAIAQEKYILKLKIDPKKVNKTYSLKNDKKINNLLKKYSCKEIVPCYPNAKKPDLLNYFI